MGKVLPEYLSNWTTEKVRKGERVITIYLLNCQMMLLLIFIITESHGFAFLFVCKQYNVNHLYLQNICVKSKVVPKK